MTDSKAFQLFDLASDSIEWANKSTSLSKTGSSLRMTSSNRVPPSASKLNPEGGPYPLESKFDCCAFVVHCTKHNQVAVSKRKDSPVWLPFTPLPSHKMWNEGAMAGSLIVLSGGEKKQFLALKSHPPYVDFTCMHVLRLQLPHTRRFITRLIYYVKLDPNNQHFKCCTNTSRLEWMSMEAVANNKVKHSWGPELAKFCRLALKPIAQHITEYTLENALVFVPREPPRNLEESILRSIKITEKDVERLYMDFLDHCFPSAHQSIDSFKNYMQKYGFETNETRLERLFKAFNNRDNGSLTFHEFLIGLALMEPFSQHGELRASFIFRYYDQDGDGYLNQDELNRMIIDIYPKESKDEILKKLSQSLSEIPAKTVNGKLMISLEDFRQAVGSHQFRGTSSLCRSSKAIFSQISRAIAERTLMFGVKTSLSGIVFNRSYKGTCTSCASRKYQLATHKVQLSATGSVTEAKRLDDEIEGEQINSALKRSIDVVFNSKHPANVILEKVRLFNQNKGTNKKPNGLMSSQAEDLLKLIQQLCQEVATIVKQETKCQKVNGPCFIIGDIHGNLEDLLSLEKAIWPRIPSIGANYLFLGDYVDRGRWSLECALYLIAFKCICPSNVTLLRGNHEVRELQVHYSYKAECLNKYGRDIGTKIWDTTNALFDKLPVSAVVDGAIYCAHGGIPRSVQKVDLIRSKVPFELNDPQHQSAIAWEILWSDPCHMSQFNDLADMGPNTDEDIDSGFIYNPKRGTAFLFNDIAVENFLAANELSYIVRAHEVPQPGYTFHFDRKCATIFSCSHYCGNANDCACILVDNPTLRVIHLDTVNNAPATE